MRLLHCTWALSLILAVPLAAQQGGAPQPGQAQTTTYLVFLAGSPIGREDVTVRPDAQGITISSQTRLGAPVNATTTRAEARYRTDWSPESLALEGSFNGQEVNFETAFRDGSAISKGTEGTRRVDSTQPAADRTFILPNMFFGAHEALGRRLAASSDTAGEFHAFVGPGADVAFAVRSMANEQMQSGTQTFRVRRYELVFANPTGELVVNLMTDERGSLVRLTAPAQGLDVVREDLATAGARTDLYSVPGDEPVMIPGAGFNIGATLTRPQATTLPARLPAVVLLGGSGVNDRDGYAAGIPMLGELARAISQAGYFVVRYDKRGTGQSGGRAESVTISDYADDARAVVNWLSKRKDVDDKRIAVVGHSEGAWVALLTASREKKIAAVAALATPAATGAELILEQQAHALDLMNATPAERAEKVALQKKIQEAVLTGSGWEGVPPALRRQADTPWFQSLLAYDPAKVVDDVRQPLLFVHGQLDRQVPVEHLDRIAALARKTSKSKSVDVVSVRGINHLLVPAQTGEVAEYATLTDRNVSVEATSAITAWLMKTFAAIR